MEKNTDGFVTRFEKMDTSMIKRTTFKITKNNEKLIQSIVIYLVSANQFVYSCNIYNSMGEKLLSASYGYNSSSNKLVAEYLYHATDQAKNSTANHKPAQRLYHRYSTEGLYNKTFTCIATDKEPFFFTEWTPEIKKVLNSIHANFTHTKALPEKVRKYFGVQ